MPTRKNLHPYFDPKGGFKTYTEWKRSAEQKVQSGEMTQAYFSRIVRQEENWDKQHRGSSYPYYAPTLQDLRGHGKPRESMVFPTINGEVTITPRNYREASKLGRYYAAVKGLDSDDLKTVKAAKSELRKLSRTSVVDANGVKHSLKEVTNLEVIRLMQENGDLPEGESIYVQDS